MLFFGKTKNTDTSTDSTQPKRRSTLGILFNPQIGETVRPLGDTVSVFVNLIAMILSMNGLLPKDHPAVTGIAGKRYTLRTIISDAHGQLSYTKDGLPKVLLFYAVIGCLVFSILSVVTIFFMMLTGTAHAQSTGGSSGFFAPPDANNDLAQNWLNYIFRGEAISNNYAQDGKPIPQTVNIQCSLMGALGFYSGAILVFAGIILFYHLISMVVHTAHEGVAMGRRANQIWAPIRLVVAVGLLVPIGTGSTGCDIGGPGLNTGQYIVIKMSEWGSGMASQAWAKFLTTLEKMKYNYIQPAVPSVNAIVRDVTEMEACKFAWNYEVCLADPKVTNKTLCDGTDLTSVVSNPDQLVKIIPGANTPSAGKTFYYSTKLMGPKNICGSYTIQNDVELTAMAKAPAVVGKTMGGDDVGGIAVALSKAHSSTFNGLLSKFTTVGGNVRYFIDGLSLGETPPANTEFTSLVVDYQKDLKSSLDSQLKVGASLIKADEISPLGWAAAGAWLNTIARNQGSIVSAYEDGLPTTIRPNLSELNNYGALAISEQLGNFRTWIERGNDFASSSNFVYNGCAAQALAAAGGSSGGGLPSIPVPTPTGPTGIDPTDGGLAGYDTVTKAKQLATLLSGESTEGKKIVDVIFEVIDLQAQRSGIWKGVEGCGGDPNTHFTLGAQLVTANPLAEFAFWGYANVRTAYSLYGTIFDAAINEVAQETQLKVLTFTKGFQGNDQIQNRLINTGLMARYYGMVASIFSLIASIFFMLGFTAGFIVPLLPFFRFFFNVLTWIVSVLEAVVSVPLIALAHLNPEGEGLPGQSAKAAYFMIFNIFLRPVMTVFGLIAGLLVFYVAIMLLNATFAVAVAGTTVNYHFGQGTLVRIIYTIIYGATVYVCANNAFKPIGYFPEHALRWIGAQAHHERMGDGGRAVQGVMGQAQGQLGDRALGIVKLKPPG